MDSWVITLKCVILAGYSFLVVYLNYVFNFRDQTSTNKLCTRTLSTLILYIDVRCVDIQLDIIVAFNRKLFNEPSIDMLDV